MFLTCMLQRSQLVLVKSNYGCSIESMLVIENKRRIQPRRVDQMVFNPQFASRGAQPQCIQSHLLRNQHREAKNTRKKTQTFSCNQVKSVGSCRLVAELFRLVNTRFSPTERRSYPYTISCYLHHQHHFPRCVYFPSCPLPSKPLPPRT